MDQNPILNDQHVVSYSSRIHLELPPREGVAALPYAEVHNPMGAYFAEASVRADAQYRSRTTKMHEKPTLAAALAT